MRIDPTGSYVDVTFGGGGHSKAILDQLTTGTLFAFDQDPDAKNNLPDHPNLVFIAANFRYIKNHLRLHGAKKVDGILADLGVSSHQFDEGSRGFSIRFDGPLDMRMNPAIGISVEEVLATYEEQALYDLFRKHTDLKSLKQIVFVDTPGIFRPKRRVDRAMVNSAWGGAADADLTVFLIEAHRGVTKGEDAIMEALKDLPKGK